MFASGGDGIDHLEWTSDGRATPERGRFACPHGPPPAPQPPRRPPRRRRACRATAAARSSRRRCARTSSPRWPTAGAADRPALVVAGDDRQARDLAADLRAWLRAAAGALLPEPRRRLRVAPRAAAAPRRPARRRARRAAATRARATSRRSSSSPRSRSARRSPTRRCARSSFTIRVGDLLDLDEVGSQLVAAGYERVDQVDDRGQFAIRGGILDVYPATEDRAVRVDLFDIEVESLRLFSTFTQRSLGEADAIEIAPAAELAPEHRELAEIAALEDADDRPDVAELLPVDRFHAFLDLAPADAAVLHRRRGGRRARARRPLAGRLRRVPRRRRPPPLRHARRDRGGARRARRARA